MANRAGEITTQRMARHFNVFNANACRVTGLVHKINSMRMLARQFTLCDRKISFQVIAV